LEKPATSQELGFSIVEAGFRQGEDGANHFQRRRRAADREDVRRSHLGILSFERT
jgi:hypothetical protein